MNPKSVDHKFGDRIDGARMIPLSNWLRERSREKVWLARLSVPFSREESERFESHWSYLHLARVKYDLPGAAFSALPGRNKNQVKKTFCSAAVGSALVAAGRLAPRANYSEFTPKDVANLLIYRKPQRLV